MPFPMTCIYCNQPYFVFKRKHQETSKYCSRKCLYNAKARLVNVNGEIQKYCNKCEVVKPFSEYHKNTRSQTGVRSECKTCQAAKMRIYVKENSVHRTQLARNWRDKNYEYYKALGRKYTRQLREEVINAYGGKCICCNESHIEFLAIDHIYNDGKEDRKIVGTSTQFYRYLKRNNYPKDRYQILCHNCNMAKAFYGQCPHQKGE